MVGCKEVYGVQSVFIKNILCIYLSTIPAYNFFSDKSGLTEIKQISTSGSEYIPSAESSTELSETIPIQSQVIFDTNLMTLDTTENCSQILPADNKSNPRKRRKHNCFFCNKEIGNFARHLMRHHSDEVVVEELLSLPPKSLKRKKLLDKVRKEGDFCTSSVVPVLNIPTKQSSEYIICVFCMGYYSRKSLRKHVKKCFFNPNPQKRFMAQSEGQTVMCGYFGPNDILTTSGLLKVLRADEVSLVAKKDQIICEIGRRYVKSHKDKHLLIVAKRKMRRLARVLISCRKIKSNNNMKIIDILKPSMFRTLIGACQDIANFDIKSGTFQSPSLALQLGTLLKNAIDCAYSLEIQKVDSSSEKLKDFNNLKTLIISDWTHEISSEAGQNLAVNKFNKPTLLPMAKDIAVSIFNLILVVCR